MVEVLVVILKTKGRERGKIKTNIIKEENRIDEMG